MSDLAQHIVKSFEQELKQLGDMLVEMGGMLENQLAAATNAVLHGDNASATRLPWSRTPRWTRWSAMWSSW